MIGIIGAMDQEIDDLKKEMKNPTVETKSSLDFWKGELCGKEVVLVRSGIGKVNATIASEILIETYKVDALINTGVAGSLDAAINIGDIVLSIDAVQHDMDVSGLGYPKSVIPDQDCSVFPADEKLRALAKSICQKVNPEIGVFEGRVASGDLFVSSKEAKDEIKEVTGAMCAEMEGGAIAHAAYLAKVPYLVIRAISDKADGSAEMDYPSFQAQAIVHTVRLVTGMLAEM